LARFTILDNEDFVLYGEWKPDIPVIQQAFIHLASRMEDARAPMLEARQVAIESTELHFDDETDPDGIPWAPLSPRYEKYKLAAGYPEDILVRTGEGKAAATSESAWFVTEDTLWFIPAALPRYMDFHQTGTQPGALSSALAKISTSMEEPTFTEEEAEALRTGAGKGRGLPQRRFVGLNDFDIELIEQIFNNWFARNIEEVSDEIPPQMGVYVGGTFPVISYTRRGQPILRTPSGPRFGRRL